MSQVGGRTTVWVISSVEQESIASCHLPASCISAQNQTLTLWALGSPLWSKFDKPFLGRLVECKYLWKASITSPVLLRNSEQQQLLLWLSWPQMLHQLDFFFNLSDVRNYAVFQVGKKKTQPPKSAKIPLRNETKVIGSLQPLFTLLLSCSSWSTEYLSLFHRMTSSLRNCNEWTGAKLFLTKHHQYKHEDFLRADSQCLCKRRAMNKSFAIIYILKHSWKP